MTSKERLKTTLNHQQPDKMVIDFGATPVTGIHVLAIERLREFYGLPKQPVKVTEPYQMLGEISDDLAQIIGIDVSGISSKNNMFGFENTNWKEFKTFWGQIVLVPGNFNTRIAENGDLLLFPEGDMSVGACARMPQSGYFFDSINRQEPIDEDNLNVADNLEEFELINDENLAYWKTKAELVKNSDNGIIVNFGGTALGDIALVPGPWMKNPKGIRDVSEWYMSTMLRMDFIKEIFEKQTDIALQNIKTLFSVFGNSIEVAYMCGTDFGTQDSQFCSPEIFSELYLPYYKKMNDWIHKNTTWKTFKHSCGSILPLIPNFIEAGFDIINPVQINAANMDSKLLKEKFGNQITFWGGGVDTQKTLSFGTPHDVEIQVLEQCEILSKNGGFIFNTIHNTQANIPIANFDAMIKAIHKFNS